MPRLRLASLLLALVPAAVRAGAAVPDCSLVRPTLDRLAVPDHSLVEVGFQGLVDVDGDPATYEVLGVTQDEPVGDTGPGDVCPDASGVGDETVLLRAERDPAGNGRVYHVRFTADVLGDDCDGEVTVCVPRDGQCGDGGPLVDAVDGACPAGCTPDRCDATCQAGCLTPFDPCAPPADALADITCGLNAARNDDTCAADRPPHRLTQLLDTAAERVAEARAATGRQATRLVKRIDRVLKRAHRLVTRLQIAGQLSADCADTLLGALRAARGDAATLLGP